MTEFDFRPPCPNCGGDIVRVAMCPPDDGRPWDLVQGRIVTVCYLCKGSGKGSYTETVELEKT